MSLETDLLLDRRRLKRRLVVWRTLAVLALVGAGLVAWRNEGGTLAGARVARLTVSGIITENRALDRQVAALADDPLVKALIVEIDSPGGSVAGGEALYDAIARCAARKPVVAVMDGIAASAGYMIAMPATRIFAQQGTLTGSIGVLLPTGEVSGLLKTLGVSVDDITSGPLKDQPSLTKPLTPEGRTVLHGLVDGHVRPVRRHGRRRTAHGPGPGARAWRRAGPTPGGRRCSSVWWTPSAASARRAPGWPRSTGAGELPVADVGAGGLAERLLRRLSTCSRAWKSVLSQGLMLDGGWASGNVPAVDPSAGHGRHDQIGTDRRTRGAQPASAPADVELIVTTIFDEITAALARGDRVELRGFGAFTVKQRDARTGRNPRTGEAVPVEERPCPSSRPARSCASG